MNGVVNTLVATGLFGAADEAAPGFAEVLGEVQAQRFDPGEVVVREGEPGDALYVLYQGSAQVYREVAGGEVVLARLEAGQHFGEQALLGGAGGRRNASVRAAAEAVILRVTPEVFQRALGGSHPLKARLLNMGQEQLWENLAAQSRLFRSLDLDADQAGGEEVTFQRGEVLMREGEDADAAYFLISGSVSVFKSDGEGKQELVSRVDEGQCVGERGLVQREPRAATVIADGLVRALRVEGQRFLDLYQRSPELRDTIATLDRVYRLPRKGFVTQHLGRFQGQECTTTFYTLPDERRLAVARVIGSEVVNLEQLSGADAPARTLRYASGETQRELRLDAAGKLVGFTAQGAWSELRQAVQLALEGGVVEAAAVEAFPRTGSLGEAGRAPEPGDAKVLCGCVQMNRGEVRTAIRGGCSTLESLQDQTGCGTVCGGCVPELIELLGGRGWTPASVEALDVAPDIKTFRLRPDDGVVQPHLAGQHVVVQAEIDGNRVERAYTLTSPVGETQCYEITVKREPLGVFSRWLFDRCEGRVRVSQPGGHVFWKPKGGPVACLVGGIGMTMGLGILRTHLRQQRREPLFFDYSVRDAANLAYAEELRAADRLPHVHVRLRETKSEGRISKEDLEAMHALSPHCHYFLCGPQAYLDAVGALLAEIGVLPHRIHIEEFVHAGGPAQAASAIEDEELEPVQEESSAAAAMPRGFLSRTGRFHKAGLLQSGLAGLVRGAWVALNAPSMDWRVFGRQLNPLRAAAAKARSAAALDPALPYDESVMMGLVATGPLHVTRSRDAMFGAQYGPNKQVAREARAQGNPLPPNTPDGDTWVSAIPTPALPKFTGKVVVQTGFERITDRSQIAFYCVRGPTGLKHLLEYPDRFDRGPLPVHVLQQVLGASSIVASPTRKPAGLLIGQLHDNLTWDEDRELGQQMFAPRTLEVLLPGMQATLKSVTDELTAAAAADPEQAHDLRNLLLRTAFALIIRASFGDLELDLFGPIGSVLRGKAMPLQKRFAAAMVGTKAFQADVQATREEMQELMVGLIEAVQELEREGQLTARQRRAVLVRAILGPQEGEAMDPGRLFAILTPLLLAGHETSGITLTWTVYELCKDPELYERVMAELDAFLARHEGQPARPDQFVERPWMVATLHEIGRVHPPTPFVFKTALSDGEVPPDPETGIGGFRYPQDAVLSASLLGANTHPHHWEDPLAFRPERFFAGITPAMSLHEQGKQVYANIRARTEAYQLMTFGAGPGVCVGRHLFFAAAFQTLDTLLSRFRFELVDPGREVVSEEGLTVGPEPGSIMVRIRPRRRIA